MDGMKAGPKGFKASFGAEQIRPNVSTGTVGPPKPWVHDHIFQVHQPER